MKDSPDTYAIVLNGHMNPSTHHPSWYRSAGLIRSVEEKAAIDSPQFFCTQEVAQFSIAEIQVLCTRNQWRAMASTESAMQRMLDLTLETFDEKLLHTPIGAFGPNFDFHRETGLQDVAEFLVEHCDTGFLDIGDFSQSALRLVLESTRANKKATIRIEPSARKTSMIFLGTNFHYDTSRQQSYYELGPVMRPAMASDHEEATGLLNRILSAIETQAKG